MSKALNPHTLYTIITNYNTFNNQYFKGHKMGNEMKEDREAQLDGILGLEDTLEIEQAKKEDESQDKQETPHPNTTLVTDEQVSITKDIAKIDLQIESLQAQNVDTDNFFENIENHLSDEEQALEFDDKSAYMKLINNKLKEYESTNSKSDEIETLKAQKLEKESVYERQSAITEVIAKYPAYKHDDVLEYFQNDLSKAQQQKIYDSSSSYVDVYEATYHKFLQSNPSNIQNQEAPTIPNVNNTRKQTLKMDDIEDSLTSEDENIQEALGL